jgi:hypothetical protein
MSRLSASQRRATPTSKMGVPGKDKAKSGAYPMPDLKHARLAEQLSGGKPVHAQVVARAKAAYPQLRSSHGSK